MYEGCSKITQTFLVYFIFLFRQTLCVVTCILSNFGLKNNIVVLSRVLFELFHTRVDLGNTVTVLNLSELKK